MMSKKKYIIIILKKLYAIDEIDFKTIDVYLLVRVKKASIFNIVNLLIILLYNYPKWLIYETITKATTNTFMKFILDYFKYVLNPQ